MFPDAEKSADILGISITDALPNLLDFCFEPAYIPTQPSQKTFKIKMKLAKKANQNRPIPHWYGRHRALVSSFTALLPDVGSYRVYGGRDLVWCVEHVAATENILTENLNFFRLLSHRFRMKTDNKIRYNTKRRHWRRTKLGF